MCNDSMLWFYVTDIVQSEHKYQPVGFLMQQNHVLILIIPHTKYFFL